LLAVSPFQIPSKLIPEVSTTTRPETQKSSMIFQSQVSVLTLMVPSSGQSETHGVPIMEKMVSSESSEVLTISLLRPTVLGPLHSIHGPTMRDITPLKRRETTH